MAKKPALTATQIKDHETDLATITANLERFGALIKEGKISATEQETALHRTGIFKDVEVTVVPLGAVTAWCGWPDGALTLDGKIWFYHKGRLRDPIDIETFDRVNLHALSRQISSTLRRITGAHQPQHTV